MHLRALRGNEEAREAEHMSTLDTVHSLSLLHAEQGFMRNLPIPHKTFERSDSGFHKIGFCTPPFNSNPLNLRGPNFFSFATDSGLLMGDQQIHVFRSTKCREPVGPIFPFGSKAQVHAAILLPLHRTAFLTYCQPVMLSHSILSLPQPHLGMPFPLSGLSHCIQPNRRFLSFCMRNHLVASLHPDQALRLTWSTFPTWLGGASVPLLVKAEHKFRVESRWLRAPHI
jgi:hypothetical protein